MTSVLQTQTVLPENPLEQHPFYRRCPSVLVVILYYYYYYYYEIQVQAIIQQITTS